MPSVPPRRRRACAALAVLALTSGCGSLSAAQLPPPATPGASPPLTVRPTGRVVAPGAAAAPRPAPPLRATAGAGTRLALLDPRGRVLVLADARTRRRLGSATAGVGPTHVVSDAGNYLYVTDTTLGAVLVYSIRPQLQLVRRYRLAGSPYATAYDPGRNQLWIAQTATNTLAELSAGRRPRLLRSFPTVRAARAVAVDAGSGRVSVTGADGVQLLDPPAVPRTR